MITRNNLKELINKIDDSEKQRIKDSYREYVMLDVSFFNAGVSVSIGLLNDLPLDYDDQISTGNVAFLYTNEVIELMD